MKSVTSHTALAAAMFLACSAPATAAAPDSLDPVIVTAYRIEVPVAQTLASVTVITRPQIEASQSPDLLDLLGRQVGVDIARSGGAGQSSTVFLRGGNSNHSLVLIDGIRVNAATSGILDFAHLPLAQIERIEIVRGPRAAIWGSEAIGGVIHIFTRDPEAAFFEARAGSYGRLGAAAGVAMASTNSRVGVSVSAETLEGFSATNDRAFGHDADADGYRNRNLALRGQTRLGTQKLSFSGAVTDADVEFDVGETAALNRVFGLHLSGPVSPRWSQQWSAGYSSEDLDTPEYASRFGSDRTSLDWINTVALDARNTLNIGVNWSRESGYTDDGSTGFDQTRRNRAVFATWLGRFGAQSWEASLRRDDNSQFDSATTGNLAWGWRASDALRVRASWGQGFRAPNFNELYYPGFSGLFQGFAGLRPERSETAEVGLDWEWSARQSLGVSAFRTRVDDLIAFAGRNFSATNINRASIDGVELQYRLIHGALSVEANATWLDARDARTGEPLLRRARRKAHVSVDYRFHNASSVGLDASAVSPRPDFGPALPGYTRLDLRAAAPLARGWNIEARIENLLDRDYQLIDGYKTPERSGMLTIRWNAP